MSQYLDTSLVTVFTLLSNELEKYENRRCHLVLDEIKSIMQFKRCML